MSAAKRSGSPFAPAAAPDLGDVVVVGDDGQVDLVLVTGVVRLDEQLGLLLQRCARPERELGAVVDPLGAGSA